MTHRLIAQLDEGNMASSMLLQRLVDEDDLKHTELLFASAVGEHITRQMWAVDGGVLVPP